MITRQISNKYTCVYISLRAFIILKYLERENQLHLAIVAKLDHKRVELIHEEWLLECELEVVTKKHSILPALLASIFLHQQLICAIFLLAKLSLESRNECIQDKPQARVVQSASFESNRKQMQSLLQNQGPFE